MMNAGGSVSTHRELESLLQALEPAADRLGSERELRSALALSAENGAMAQRRIGSKSGVAAVAPWLAERFLAPTDG